MKPLTILSLLLLFFTACKKHHSTPVQQITFPYDSLLEGGLTQMPDITLQASGVLIARKVTTLIDSLPPSTFYSAEAYFPLHDTAWKYANAGSVSLNSINIPVSQRLYDVPFPNSNIYYYRATAAIWNDANPNGWQVSGNGNTLPFSATVNLPFPDFDTSIVPNTLPLNSPLQITFNNTNTSNATYAYVILHNGNAHKSQDVPATGGTISLSSSYMTQIEQQTFPGYVYIDVVVYNIQYQMLNSKRYAFITQRSCIKKLHFY